ncbi:MAG: DUF4349 domain-containing protein [Candidatus Magasanikbacteria bacterium]|nr:DUF4349 domain-containing protein [Candidatus Magasanikbacteria bacterium]
MSKKVKITLGVVGVLLFFIILVSLVRYFDNPALESEEMLGYNMLPSVSDMDDIALTSRVSGEAAQFEEKSMAVDYAPTSAVDGESTAAMDRLIIKTGLFSLLVDDVNLAVDQIKQYATEKGGFLVSSNVYKSGLAPYATVVIRIPATEFDKGVEKLQGMGEVTSQRIDGQDVTEEYVDLEAQLRNFRATEEQYLNIMKQAYEIEDILAVQTKLSDVRNQIERIEGRMKYLKQSADLSTITVNLSTDPEVLPAVDDEDKWKPWAEVKEALRSLVNLGKALSYVVIWFVIYIPLWIGLVLAGWLVYRLFKRIFGKKV